MCHMTGVIGHVYLASTDGIYETGEPALENLERLKNNHKLMGKNIALAHQVTTTREIISYLL